MTDGRSNNGKEDDVRRLRIDSLREPDELYPRVAPDPAVIDRYRDILKDLPPITVTISDDEELDRIIVDGMHRKRAFEAEGRKTIPCKLEPVENAADVLAMSARRNIAHGLPLTSEERRHVAEELWQQGMDKKQIAGAVGRSRRTVNRWLAPLEEECRTQQREEVVRLHDEEDMPFAQIAKKLDVSPRTVRRRYDSHRAESPDDDGAASDDRETQAPHSSSNHKEESPQPNGSEVSPGNTGLTPSEVQEVKAVINILCHARKALEGLLEGGPVTAFGHEQLIKELMELQSAFVEVQKKYNLLAARKT